MYIAPSPIDLLNRFNEKAAKLEAYVHNTSSQLSGVEVDPAAAKIEGISLEVVTPKLTRAERSTPESFLEETLWSA